MIRALAFLALATPAAAFDIDYAQVFAANPDAITRTGDNTRRLDLPGDVHVVETTLSDGTRSYFGYDDSMAGAAGCTFEVLVDVVVTQLACPQLLEPGEIAALATNLETSAFFVAANTVPQVAPQDVAARLRTHVDARAAQLAEHGITCPAADDPELMPMIRFVASPAFARMLTALHTVPRLPVSNPCM